jgi:hypothetical protein
MTVWSKYVPVGGAAWLIIAGWAELCALAVAGLPNCDRAATPSVAVRSMIAKRALALLSLENLLLLSASPGLQLNVSTVKFCWITFMREANGVANVKLG